MAPLSKVSLVEQSCEILNDDASGPYSMLFIEPKHSGDVFVNNLNKKNVSKQTHDPNIDRTVCVIPRDSFNDSLSKEVSNEFNFNKNKYLDNSCTRNILDRNISFNSSEELNKAFIKTSKETYNECVQNSFNLNFAHELNPTIIKDITNNSCMSDKLVHPKTHEAIINEEKDTCEVIAPLDAITAASPTCNSDRERIENKIFETHDPCSSATENNITYLPANKLCENLPNDSYLGDKNRRTSNPKNHKSDTLIFMNLPDSIVDKPSSLPQPRNPLSFISPPLPLNKFNHLTSTRGEFAEALLRKLRIGSMGSGTNKAVIYDDDNSKRDSLEFEESLGILTPDQMVDGMTFANMQTRSPSLECENNICAFSNKNQECSKKFELQSPKDTSLGILDEKVINLAIQSNKEFTFDVPGNKESKTPNIQSPNLNSITDYSLGIIDEHMISNIALKASATIDMELPLNYVDKSIDFTLTRLELTPSPEELPLDPTPITISEFDSKTEQCKSKTTNSFITSITSITSLDTGYQGDGEMSRPASRGGDNSPLTRRPLPRPQTRCPDPMTDSDFYTESDADNHEDNQLRGDRRAQVIDGTLYGVDPQTTADIYVNNRENMDSSGIFTDLENNARNEENIRVQNPTHDVSPSEISSKTISENSQSNLQEILEKSSSKAETKDNEKYVQKEKNKKRIVSSPGVSSLSSVSSLRHGGKEENFIKKSKTPNRDVESKVKAMMAPNQSGFQNQKKTLKKAAGRWDAVMNKISKCDQTKTNLKEVKSKVFNNINVNGGNSQRQNEIRKQNALPLGSHNSPTNKNRRIRNRISSSSTPKNIGNNTASSIHSSLSDLSATTAPQRKHLDKSLTSSNETKVRRTLFSPKEKKQLSKECGRSTVKGGRTLPCVRPSPQSRVLNRPQVPRVAEAFAILVQHLVFSVEAYQVPSLRRQVERFRSEADDFRILCQKLENTLADERIKLTRQIEEERSRFQSDITELIKIHKNQVTQLNSRHADIQHLLRTEKESLKNNLCKHHEKQLYNLKKEFEKLQNTHEESLDILREENDSIREQIDEKRFEIEKVNRESMKLKKDHEYKEMALKEKIQKLYQQVSKDKGEFEEKLKDLVEENRMLKEENDSLLSYGDDKGIGVQEVQSLRAVLELKQNEVAELRKALAETKHKADVLVGAEEKTRLLNARCEDLQLQLQRKSEYEQVLIQENLKLQESFKDESNQKRRLSQYNEELQWKLKQNKEVISKILEHAEESAFNRSILSSSVNEKHNPSRLNLERTLSFRERTYSNRSSISIDNSIISRKSKNVLEIEIGELSPPPSPKVKGVVEKCDSVSYVLDLDESPEIVASRIVRRSFRNSTPPKTTPTKSPSNKRPRIRNSLCQSASSSAIISIDRSEIDRPRSASARNDECDNENVFLWAANVTNMSKLYVEELDKNYDTFHSNRKLDASLDLDEEHDVDIKLPALPSELERQHCAQALPSPKHLAGEAMISESNSEDESTSSSQL